MVGKRSKKRNYLTENAEIAELAYALHVSANRLRATVTQINIPAAFRLQILRHIQWMTTSACALGVELSPPDENAFTTKEAAEKVAELLGLFED
jgi:hypothetical protein